MERDIIIIANTIEGEVANTTHIVEQVVKSELQKIILWDSTAAKATLAAITRKSTYISIYLELEVVMNVNSYQMGVVGNNCHSWKKIQPCNKAKMEPHLLQSGQSRRHQVTPYQQYHHLVVPQQDAHFHHSNTAGLSRSVET